MFHYGAPGQAAVGKAEIVGRKGCETKKVTARHGRRTDAPHLAGFAAKKTQAVGRQSVGRRHLYRVPELGGVTVPHPTPNQGSKRTLASAIDRYQPEKIDTFCEPFAGSAAMTIYAAFHRRASRYVIADSREPMISLLQAIVEDPEDTAAKYGELWRGQSSDDERHFYRISDGFNERREHVDLLYLICRCVKNSVRSNGSGGFSQSDGRRRLGMRPGRMRKAMLGVHVLLNGRAVLRVGDWLEITRDAGADDFIYMDPPYLGTSVGPYRRYHQQTTQAELVGSLTDTRRRDLSFAPSYDGMTGERSYVPPLPASRVVERIMLKGASPRRRSWRGAGKKPLKACI